MEIMLNGQLVTCTPDEYARLVQLGLIPNAQKAGTTTTPNIIGTPTPKLPDDIVKLPEDNFPQYPKIGDTPDWARNRMHVVPLYGCVVDRSALDSEPLAVQVTQNVDTLVVSTQTNKATRTYYVLKKVGEDKWWSSQAYQYLCDNASNAYVYISKEQAEEAKKNLKDRFGDFEIQTVER